MFENSGKLSIMPVGEKRPTVANDLNIKIEQPQLPNYLIVDGRISYSGLNQLNKDEIWLINKLDIKDKKQLKNILLATYDDKTNTVVVNYEK